MTADTDPFARLAALCDAGHLRFVYVDGVARSNSTVVCKILGDRLDGAVYEPAMPVATSVKRHYAEVILRAYDAARVGKPAGEPVLLAIKDLSLFVDEGLFDFVLAHAAHIVFTVRDPLTQYPSLVTQFKTEFGVRNRVDALVRYPVETCMLGFYTAILGTGYFADAARTVGFSPAASLLLPIIGWNLTSWRNVVWQFDAAQAKLGADRVTVLDAGLMRLLPGAATAALEAIAARVRGDSRRTSTPVDLAAHSRMFPRSAWAKEARHSDAIKPLSSSASRRPKNAFEEKVLAAFYPDFAHLFFNPANGLLAAARAQVAEASAQPFRHLLDAASGKDALARLLGRREAVAWRDERPAAAE
jgi:hypothetical protein